MRLLKTNISKQIPIISGFVIISLLGAGKDPEVTTFHPAEVCQPQIHPLQVPQTKCNLCMEMQNPHTIFLLQKIWNVGHSLYQTLRMDPKNIRNDKIRLCKEKQPSHQAWLLTKTNYHHGTIIKIYHAIYSYWANRLVGRVLSLADGPGPNTNKHMVSGDGLPYMLTALRNKNKVIRSGAY